MDMMIDPNVVRELRSKKSWSQEDLAIASGLSLRTVQRVESEGSAALETRRALAGAFDVLPEELKISIEGNDPRLPTLGFGLLSIWIGIAWFFEFGFAVGLTGVGVVWIGCQVLQVVLFKRGVQWHEVTIGSFFLISGAVTLLDLQMMKVLPVLLIAAGCMLAISALRR